MNYELDIINYIKKLDSSKINNRQNFGIGDDCAFITDFSKKGYLISTDLLIEKIHFDLKTTDLYSLGKKSVLVNISDILSSGGFPKYIFLNLGIPKKLKNLNQFLDGINDVCKKYDIKILGGDTSSSKTDFFIGITILGNVFREVKRRSSAKADEFICVTGKVGLSGTGFYALKQNFFEEYKESIAFHRIPEILSINETQILAEYTNASMDNSDGLYSTIFDICENSGVGCLIDFEKIPLHFETKKFANNDLKKIEKLLNFGEDYNCVFTVSFENLRLLELKFNNYSVIGKLTESVKKQILKQNKKIELKREGFLH